MVPEKRRTSNKFFIEPEGEDWLKPIFLGTDWMYDFDFDTLVNHKDGEKDGNTNVNEGEDEQREEQNDERRIEHNVNDKDEQKDGDGKAYQKSEQPQSLSQRSVYLDLVREGDLLIFDGATPHYFFAQEAHTSILYH
jgi:hypothetical protein